VKRLSVVSESIASLGFDPRRGELDVEFRESGDIYRYFEVSAEEYAAFLAAESKGAYLNHVFKPKGHRYRVMKRGAESGLA
jgi:KTSC domain